MVLFPDNPHVQEMVDNWQKSVRSRALPEEAMTGWNEGMTRLQQLAERLNRLDEQRGKYMTVSELRTEVFGIMQAFNRHIPAEEQLRRYDEARNQNGSEQQQKQAEMALNQLINRYQVEHAGKPEVAMMADKTGEWKINPKECAHHGQSKIFATLKRIMA